MIAPVPCFRSVPALLAAAVLSGCALIAPMPEASGVAARLATIPTAGAAVQAPVTIHWDDHQIPFIEAASDADAAFALGLVHAHLRLGQMEILRRISQGRLAEMGGPIAADLDRALRILDFGKVSAAAVAAMPGPERDWVDAFVAGINHYQQTVETLPHEFAVLGLEREPWRAEEIFTLGRLASTDVTWLVWFRLLALRGDNRWPALWSRLIGAGTASVPSFEAAGARLNALEQALSTAGRFGSNSMVVAGKRSTGGAAMIASDPHLGLNLPNLWLIAGLKSPSYHMLGLMVPGLPFVAVGRNPKIAWGGTNLRAAASDLFDVSGLPPDRITSRTEPIAVRWWFDTAVTVRETPYGPIVSDVPMLAAPPGERWALRWIGHRPSDELTAMLRLNRAADWADFRSALDGFALSAQNFVYADAAGNIGQVTATQLPRRPPEPPSDLVRPLADARYWDSFATARDLPAIYNPAAGVLATANNRSAPASILLGYFFSSNDRITRLQALLAAHPKLDVGDLRRIQRDTLQPSSLLLRDRMLARLAAGPLAPAAAQAAAVLRGWDGRYDADAAGPVVFEAALAHLTAALEADGVGAAYAAVGRPLVLIAEDLVARPLAETQPMVEAALAAGAAALAEFPSWGAMHRLGVGHLLGLVPVLGRRYRFGDQPTGGSRETVWKSGHEITGDRHLSRFGANARHISDLSDPDANWFVLLGGQDGWFNSTTFLDQLPLWLAGDSIQLPLTPERVRQRARYHTILRPASGADTPKTTPRRPAD